jgi:hypothetical protein
MCRVVAVLLPDMGMLTCRHGICHDMMLVQAPTTEPTTSSSTEPTTVGGGRMGEVTGG